MVIHQFVMSLVISTFDHLFTDQGDQPSLYSVYTCSDCTVSLTGVEDEVLVIV